VLNGILNIKKSTVNIYSANTVESNKNYSLTFISTILFSATNDAHMNFLKNILANMKKIEKAEPHN
jgi:hypothetical protein